jgi:RNA polymerase sigma factor (sigma-70 family)
MAHLLASSMTKPMATVPEEQPTSALADTLAACLREERAAQQRLYQQFYNALFAACLRYAPDHDTAKDLVNQAFLKIFRSLASLHDHQAFPAWAKRIAINVCLDYVRRQPAQPYLSLDDSPEPAIMAAALDQIDEAALLGLVQQLPPATRAVFSLFAVEGYNHAEIAVQLGMSEGTSRWHLSAARKELKRLLQNRQL